jgi:hypothetical protein
VLDSTRDTSTQVQLRSDVLTSLANLQTVIGETAVNSGTRGTNGSAERVGERLHDTVKLLLGLETTTTRHNTGSGRQVGALGLGQLLGHPLGLGGGVGVHAVDDLGGAALGLDALEGGASHGDDLDVVGRLNSQDGVTGVDGADES